MAILATVRYLTMEQIARLMFAERNTINLLKRLLALAGQGKYGVEQPYLKRLSYPDWLGQPQTAWMLTPLGYNVAESVLSNPPRRPSAETGAKFMEHGLMLNELYVQLLEAPLRQALATARRRAERENRPSRSFTKMKAGLYARAVHPGLRWQSHDEVRLPWRGYDNGHRAGSPGKERDRVIIPDATLEIPGELIRTARHGAQTKYAGRRWFLEAETGSQSVEAEGDTKPGATINKLDRYTSYIHSYAGNPLDDDHSTWYTRAWPDGFEPSLLFLVRTAGRAATVNAAIKQWVSQGNRNQINAKALTVEEAATELLGVLGPSWGATLPAGRKGPDQRKSQSFASGEFQLLLDFSRAAFLVIQNLRAVAREREEPLPEYPKQVEEVRELVARLAAGG